MDRQQMCRAQTNGTELEYEVHGHGEPVLLIHGSILADAFDRLMEEPILAERFQLISYHRRGYAGSARPSGPVSLAMQAEDAVALLHHLGIDGAHIVGHSYGGAIAMQFALDTPEAVHSLALLEPAMMAVPSGTDFVTSVIVPAFEHYEAGDKAKAIDTFMRGVGGADYRQRLEPVLPSDAFALAIADADTFFQVELPAMQQWRFGREEARQIGHPVLAVLGTESSRVWPGFAEAQELLQSWFPQAETFLLPSAAHPLQMLNPEGMAVGLTGFWARHPSLILA